jgi:hypothetical protein
MSTSSLSLKIRHKEHTFSSLPPFCMGHTCVLYSTAAGRLHKCVHLWDSLQVNRLPEVKTLFTSIDILSNKNRMVLYLIFLIHFSNKLEIK